MQHSPVDAAGLSGRRRSQVVRPLASRLALAVSGCCLVLAPASALPIDPPFSLDKVASRLQQLADQVPDEGYPDHLVEPSGCNCGGQGDDSQGEEASANVADEDFQVAPSDQAPNAGEELDKEANLQPSYSLAMLQRSASGHRVVAHDRGMSHTGCNCVTKNSAANSKALSLATSGTTVTAGSGDGETEAKPTGIWVYTCFYSQQDLVFWRLTNTAYLRGGIVLKETIAYTDTCKMCEYNNVGCNKKEVELTDGNCLCMWRMNGVEMNTMLLSCSACVSDCIGVVKSFDLGKPEPGMQKGICLRKKPHKSLDDLEPLTVPDNWQYMTR